MLNHELKQYLVDKGITPIVLEVTSRSTRQKVLLAYLKHPIDSQSTKELMVNARGLYTTCAITLDTMLLLPKEALGTHIGLMDAIDAVTIHMEGKTNKLVVEQGSLDLSNVIPTNKKEEPPVTKKTTVKKVAAKKAKAPAKKKVVVAKKSSVKKS